MLCNLLVITILLVRTTNSIEIYTNQFSLPSNKGFFHFWNCHKPQLFCAVPLSWFGFGWFFCLFVFFWGKKLSNLAILHQPCRLVLSHGKRYLVLRFALKTTKHNPCSIHVKGGRLITKAILLPFCVPGKLSEDLEWVCGVWPKLWCRQW